MNPDRAATALSVRQGGILRRDQALAFGLTRGQIARRVEDGRWRRLGTYGYRLIEMSDPLDQVRAAIAALPDAVVSHHTAGELHGLARLPSGIASVSVHARTTHWFPGVEVHRSQDIQPAHLTEVDGLPITTIPRTIVDLAAVLTQRHLAIVVDEALAEGQTSVGQARLVLDEVARRGKPGVRALRKVLDIRSPGPERGSQLERFGARVLIGGGLAEPEYEFPIPWATDRRFDAAYPHRSLGIEWDSRRWHSQVDAIARDRARDREAVLHGWRVLRFTWEDLTQHPNEVVDTVRRALEQPIANPGL